MQVVIISMPHHKQRRKRLLKMLAPLGYLRFKWIPAVNGRKLSPSPPWKPRLLGQVYPHRQWIDPYARRAMTMGEVGCSLSHVYAWRYIARSKKPAIVLEDDADVIGPLINDLSLVLEDLDHIDFDLCYLAQRNNHGPKRLAGRFVHIVDYHPLWTLAYLITPQAAEYLLDATPWANSLIPADEMLPAAFGLNREPALNDSWRAKPGVVVATNQRYFTPAESSISSDTERSPPVRVKESRLQAFTVATKRTPELERLLESGWRYGFEITPLGLGEEWRGGHMAAGTGGGQKINLLRSALAQLPPRQPVLFVDGYDTIITRHGEDILEAWRKLAEDKCLFAAEPFCWPDAQLADRYADGVDTPYRFLNSGAFIGTTQHLYKILDGTVADSDDDQRYYTQRFLSGQYPMVLDHRCDVFQCLNGALDDVEVDLGRGALLNKRTQSTPSVIHANGPTKNWLDGDGRAVGGRWRHYYGDMAG